MTRGDPDTQIAYLIGFHGTKAIIPLNVTRDTSVIKMPPYSSEMQLRQPIMLILVSLDNIHRLVYWELPKIKPQNRM
jgi:hypothetical protein